MIEGIYRPLKSAIKCHATERWTEVLPIILLGLRASLKEDILCTPAELAFFLEPLFDCREMFDSSKPDDDVVNLFRNLSLTCNHFTLNHKTPPWQTSNFYPSRTVGATHVFLRRDMLCRPSTTL
ncbi:integrase catalytic domain-containing protein [Trichonephila clavipes]|nr:integrase catalytic domain-containing protein [Trichonephila clavipes]